MRIVGGAWRGRALEAPEGRGTRPTTDRMRETIASMVLSAFDLDLEGVSVLDAFAGSGAMGLEFLSRGAKRCTFVDSDRRAVGVVRRNVSSLGAQTRCDVLSANAFQLAGRGATLPGAPYDLVVLDPPYATPAQDVSGLVDALSAAGALVPGAVVLYERASSAPALEPACATLVRERAHGTTTVDLYRTAESE